MYARATSGKQENNFKLSKCSIEQIYPVLDVKASGADGCFVGEVHLIKVLYILTDSLFMVQFIDLIPFFKLIKN
jgi:hypothetical protein